MWQSKPSCGEAVDSHGKKSGRSEEKSGLDRAKTKKKKQKNPIKCEALHHQRGKQ